MQGIPIGLVVLGIVSFKTGRFEEMFDWTTTSSSYHYMPRWVSRHRQGAHLTFLLWCNLDSCGKKIKLIYHDWYSILHLQ